MRAARAVVTSAVVAALAAAAHTAGGGQLPSVPVLAALGALVLLTVTVLARWQLRLWTLLPVLAGLQAALHGALSFLAPGTASAVVNPAWTHAHGAAQAPFALVSSSPMLPGHEMAAMPVMSAAMPAMLLAHAAATVVTALVLVGADDAARRTVCWLRAVLPLIVSPSVAPIAAVARAVAAQAPGFVLIARGLVASRPRRGPPLGLATA
jgi:hypothetical protein